MLPKWNNGMILFQQSILSFDDNVSYYELVENFIGSFFRYNQVFIIIAWLCDNGAIIFQRILCY